MSNDQPFGFTPDDPDDDTGGSGTGPGGGSGGFPGFPGMPGVPGMPGGDGPGGFDMNQIGAMLQQLGAFMQQPATADAGAVNWELANDTARKILVSEGDPSINDGQRSATETAVDLAEVWLDGTTMFPATGGRPAAWSRSEWLTATLPAWRGIIDPLAERVSNSMTAMLPGEGELGSLPAGIPPEMASMIAPLLGMAKQMGASMFAMQVAQGLAALAAEVVSAGDVGVPLTDDGRPALLPGNVRLFGEGLGVAERETLLFLALRECAHQRLFAHVPWLRARMQSAVEDYARGIAVDTDRIESAIAGIDPTDQSAIQDVLSSGVFVPEDTPEQRAALERLETLLALVEGWVDAVVSDAAGDRLASLPALQEAIRRRRASGGPAERTFATLVGLEMRPRKLREAATLWAQLSAQRGQDGRDAVWQHPDLLPTAADLEHPETFVTDSDPDTLVAEIENFANSAPGAGTEQAADGPDGHAEPEAKADDTDPEAGPS